MKPRLTKWLLLSFIFILAFGFIAKFGTPKILKAYIETGIGSCLSIPILCMAPEENEINFNLDKAYIQELIPFTFPRTKIYAPKGFKIVQELIEKPFYKKRRQQNEPVIYILHQEPDFFIKLYPQVRKAGIDNNFLFLKHIMFAQESKLINLSDAFFVIMKGIFIPDLGDQRLAKMIQIKVQEKKCFINYNLSKSGNYFDCNIVDQNGDFFKVYIKDTRMSLDLNKVVSIISTISVGE
ncbi:MAG: hypothetical protein V2A64_07800 [Candidatus Omnitrophota bacterium]